MKMHFTRLLKLGNKIKRLPLCGITGFKEVEITQNKRKVTCKSCIKLLNTQ